MTALAAHYTPEHQMFRDTCRRFFEKEVTPFHMKWEEEGIVPRELWRKAGEQGLLGMTMPEEYGGAGADFLYSAILIEEQGRALASGPAFSLHNDIVVPYLLHYGSEEQKKKWIPKACSGELVTAIAMTEPGTGSDLQAVKTNAVMDGNHWVINGSKTFISNGQLADLVIVVAKTDPKLGAKGTSLIAVETNDRRLQARPQSREDRHEGAGHVGAVLRQCARAGRPPAGRPRHGLHPAHAAAAAGAAGHRHPGDRRHRGGDGAHASPTSRSARRSASRSSISRTPASSSPSSRPRRMVARVFVDDCMARHLKGELDVATAAMAKYYTTDLQCELIDECLQFFGGYGYMWEYPIARLYADARVQKIYGGTNEIMKELIGRTL